MNSIEQAREALTVTYRNWRGEVGERTITPIRVWFGATDWHPEPQWLLEAFDHDKGANRDFALKDFGASPSTPVDGVGAEPVAWRFKWRGDSPWTVTDSVPSSADIAGGPAVVAPLYAAPLANPEAEARLRERVAGICDCELGHNGIGLAGRECDCLPSQPAQTKWLTRTEILLALKSAEFAMDWAQPHLEADPVTEERGINEAHKKALEEVRTAIAAAEARLAQAERAPGNSYVGFGFDPRSNEEYPVKQAEGGPAVTEAWQPIESAPLDGTTVDLWHEDFGRHTDHYWGVPSHECGEAGSFCDSDWHSISEGWVDGTFNSLSDEPQGFTHWMPHPKPPAAIHPQSPVAAEGGPAVTEAPSYYIESIVQPLDDIHVGPGGDCEWIEVAAARDEIRRRIEAALHPQSAAGEEEAK